MDEPGRRKRLAHPHPVERPSRPIVLFVTVRVVAPDFSLTCAAVHDNLRSAWTSADQWRVGAYTIMPDHVHLFCVPGVMHPVNITQWNKFWKGQFRRLMKLERSVWQRDGWDTQMRDYDQYVEKRAYVRENPVRKGLVASAKEWSFQGELHVIQW